MKLSVRQKRSPFYNFYLALNNSEAGYLLALTLLVFCFSVSIWYVLYKIPDRHGLISRPQYDKNIVIDNKGSIYLEGTMVDVTEEEDGDGNKVTKSGTSALREFMSMSKDGDDY